MAEMQEMIERKVFDKMTKVVARLGEINPDFSNINVQELCAAATDESEDSDHGDENLEDDNQVDGEQDDTETAISDE